MPPELQLLSRQWAVGSASTLTSPAQCHPDGDIRRHICFWWWERVERCRAKQDVAKSWQASLDAWFWDKSVLPMEVMIYRDSSSSSFLPCPDLVLSLQPLLFPSILQPCWCIPTLIGVYPKCRRRVGVKEKCYQNTGYEGEEFQGLSKATDDWKTG